MPRKAEALSSVKTLNKLVLVLDSFTAERPAWSLAELSVRLSMPKSSLHRLLVGLEQHGILIRDGSDSLWRLGYRLFAWGNLVPQITGLQPIARGTVRWLAEKTRETVLLTVVDRQEVVCIDKVESSHAVRLTLDIGARRPLHAGASSKILMAFLSPEEIESILRQKGLPRLNTNTITDPVRLAEELEAIRQKGCAFSYEETDIGAWGVATPILDSASRVVAAIGVAGPTTRYTDEIAGHFVELCRQAAMKVTQQLAGRRAKG